MSIRDKVETLVENVSFRRRKPSVKKQGNTYTLSFPLESDPDDVDQVEEMGHKLNRLLKPHGVRITMSIDDEGEDDEQEPLLSIQIITKGA